MTNGARRSIWAWGLESDEPSHEERVGFAKSLAEQWGRDLPVPKAVPLSAVELRRPRIDPSEALWAFCVQDPYERAFHSYGSHFTERLRAFRGEFPNPPDLVAHPRDEDELERVLSFCTDRGCRAVPWVQSRPAHRGRPRQPNATARQGGCRWHRHSRYRRALGGGENR